MVANQSNSQVLENPRLLKKIERLKEARELTKFYNDQPNNLSLKSVLKIRKKQSCLNINNLEIFPTQNKKKNLSKKQKQELREKNYPLAIENIKASLKACGKWAKHEIRCKKCNQEGIKEDLLEVIKQIHICEMRLCSKPLCVSLRYARAMEVFEKIRRLVDLVKLRHFSVGFDKISKEEFENNFDYHKKKCERVLNNYFKVLKKGNYLPYEFRNKKNLIKAHPQDIQNQMYIKKHPNDVFFEPIKIQGFKVLDISKGKKVDVILKSISAKNKKSFYLRLSKKEFDKMFGNSLERNGIKFKIVEWDEQYYIHFHFAIIPFKSGGREVATMKAVEQMIKKKQRKKVPFFYKDYGNKNKKAILSYLTIRLIGLYKKKETEKDDVDEIKDYYNAKDIRKSLLAGKWMALNQLVNTEQYVKHFYKKRNLSTIGNSYFCFNCKKAIPLRIDGKPTYEKDEEKICPYCNSNEVKLAMPKSLQGTISSDIMVWIYCKHHGKFSRDDHFNLIHTYKILEDPPPPNIQTESKPKSISILVHATRRDVMDIDGNLIKFVLNSKTPEQIRKYETKRLIKQIKKSKEKRIMDEIKIINPKTMEPFSEEDIKIKALVRISNSKINNKILQEIKKALKIKCNGIGDYEGFGIDKINLERFAITKTNYLKIFQLTEQEKNQGRLNRFLDLRNNKFKLTLSDRVDLAIKGRC